MIKSNKISSWRLVLSLSMPPNLNMALDELFLHRSTSDTPPILRIYTWDPPAVSLGYAQKSHRHLNLNYCRQNNIPIVRRPTGGKAVYHDREVTYAIIGNKAYYPFNQSLMETYRSIGSGFVKSLECLGVKANMATQRKRAIEKALTSCFAQPSAYEILVHNKKIIGSAQKRTRSAVLQHGSILLNYDHERWRSIMKNVGDQSKQRIGVLNRLCNRVVTVDEVKDSLITGFTEAFGIKFISNDVSCEELETARSLASVYDVEAW